MGLWYVLYIGPYYMGVEFSIPKYIASQNSLQFQQQYPHRSTPILELLFEMFSNTCISCTDNPLG